MGIVINKKRKKKKRKKQNKTRRDKGKKFFCMHFFRGNALPAGVWVLCWCVSRDVGGWIILKKKVGMVEVGW